MSLSVNFNIHSKALLSSYQAVLNGDKDTEWVVYGYDKGGNDLKVLEKGAGGLEELVEEFNDGRIQYAFVRVIDPNTELPKFVLIGWCGEGVPEIKKGLFNSHFNEVSKFLKGYHLQINARSEADVDPAYIMKRISESGGSKYSININKERARKEEPILPVNSVYERVKIPDFSAQRQSSREQIKPVSSVYQPVQLPKPKPLGKFSTWTERAENSTSSGPSPAELKARRERERAEKEERERIESEEKERKEREEKARQLREEKERKGRKESDEKERKVREEKERKENEEKERKRLEKVERERIDREERERLEAERLEAEMQKLEIEEAERREQAEQEEMDRIKHEKKLQIQRETEERSRKAKEDQVIKEKEKEEWARRDLEEREERKRLEYEREQELYQQQEAERLQLEQLEQEQKLSQTAEVFAESADGITAVVQFAYDATEDNEISLREGEIIRDIIQLDEGWWQGVGEDGRTGLFPANYVEIVESVAFEQPIEEAQEVEAEPVQLTVDSSRRSYIAKALFDYDAGEENEISFQDGAIITDIEFVSDDWWQGKAPDGKVGLFPETPVPLNPISELDLPQSSMSVTSVVSQVSTEVQSNQHTRQVQNNKARCFKCRAKIPLAKQTINKCRCGDYYFDFEYVFCDSHKVPDKHDCDFDFAKMGKDILAKNNPKLNDVHKGGRSFNRID
ncbi:20553_t:CDS:10 [Funneliformis geosporum]|nr:20553_t:CDS:10 [Funneliformis geosporum]